MKFIQNCVIYNALFVIDGLLTELHNMFWTRRPKVIIYNCPYNALFKAKKGVILLQ